MPAFQLRRPTSTAIHGLSLHWPGVPMSMMFSTSGRIGSSAGLITTFLTVHAGGPPVQPSGMCTVAHPPVPGVQLRAGRLTAGCRCSCRRNAGRRRRLEARVARAGDEREEERAVGPRPHRRVGAEVGMLRLQRSGEPRASLHSGMLIGTAAERRRAPRRAAVNGLVDLDPGFRIVQLFGNLDGDQAVIVRTGKQVPRIARRNRDRRLVLLGQERVAFGPLGARDHVDVRPRDGRRRNHGANGHAETGGDECNPPGRAEIRAHDEPSLVSSCNAHSWSAW